MSENKRFNITEWMEDKKHRMTVIIIIVVLVAFALIVRVVSQIIGMDEESRLPDSGLLAEKGEYVEKELPYYLSSSITNSVLNINIAVLDDMEKDGAYLIGEKDGITYMIGSTDDTALLLSEYMYVGAVMPVYGTDDIICFRRTDQGYIGNMAAESCIAGIEVQISTKRQMIYTLAYVVSVEDISGVGNNKLMLYAISETPEGLKEAQVVLKEMAYSVRKLDMSVFEEKEEEEVTPFSPSYYPIDVYWNDASEGYVDTVLLLMWNNTNDAPDKLEITGPDGQVGVLNEEYSIVGHYLYEFGITNGGEYHLVGETQKQLTGASIMVTSMEDYINMYHYYEVYDDMPDYITERDDSEYYEEHYGE